MTSPNGQVPEGAFVSGGAGQSALADLNTLTEAEAKRRMQARVVPSFGRQRDGFWGVARDFVDMVTGRYTGPVQMFIDGQTALNNRIDLLGKSGYCAATMGTNFRIGPSRLRALPFDTQVGPAQGAELALVNRQHPGAGTEFRDEWCIKLNRKGLWQASAAFVHAGDGFDSSFAEIVVLNPDLTPFSYTTLPASYPRADSGATDDVTRGVPVVIPKMFVVPDAGYYVQVRWRFDVLVGMRTAKGGTKMSQFSVTQWAEDVSHTAAPETVTATTDDTK